MNSGLKTRAKKIEDRVLIGADRREYDRLRRRYYNTRGVTTAALLAEMLGLLRETKEPTWVREEFERPIPADADKQRLLDAEALARDTIAGRPVREIDTPMTAKKILEVFGEHGLTGGLDTLDSQIEEMRDQELRRSNLCRTGRA